MLNLVFGIPQSTTRGASKEKYTDKAVLTMLLDKGKKTAKKFEFNKLASELLGLGDESSVSISFSEGNIFIVNSTSVEGVPGYTVTKNAPKSFSNSKMYDYITTFLGLSNDVDNEFELTAFNDQMYNNAPICKVTLMSNQDVEEVVEVQEDTETQSVEETSIYGSISEVANV